MKKYKPAKGWPTRWLFDDWSDEEFEYQVIDLLHDIRLMLFWLIIAVVLFP